MNPLIRSLFSATTLFLIIFFGVTSAHNLLAWGCLVAMALIYLVMIWTPISWWTRARYAMGVSLVIGLAGILLWSPPGGGLLPSGLLLIPLILLLGRQQGDQRRFATLLAVFSLAGMVALAPGVDYIWTVLPVVIALYMSVRAINIYKESYQLSQQNVAALSAAHRELQDTYATLQAAMGHSVRYAALAERARLAREIHDGLGHQLTSLIVQLQALEIMLPGDPERAARAVPAMLTVARKSMLEVRQAIETWSEDQRGLGLAALQGLVTQHKTIAPYAVEFQSGVEFSEWPEPVSVALYRILQEALTNVMRHAQATAVSIQVWENEKLVHIVVADDGCFTEDKPLTPGYGINGMQERSQQLRGDCRISQNHPHGMKLQAWIPIEQPQVNQPIRNEPNE